MDFFLKIFKALNSAQHPWQVTLSITLGMVAGLTPLSGTQTFFILFIVFLLNIHLGLFFAASALFAGIAYLLDPLMESFGFMLLHLEQMQELYTTWYNIGLIRLSHFNNTLMMGATVISLVLALPLFLILNIIISLYRDKIANFFNKSKWLSRLGIFKVENKKEPIFRWWGAGLYLLIVGGVAGLLILVIDPVMKWGIEKAASKTLKKDVKIAAVTTHLFEGRVIINRLEVPSDKEGVDSFSIEKIALSLNTEALLYSKAHIELMEVKEIGFDTKAHLKKVYGKAAYKTKVEQEKKLEAAAEAKEDESTLKMPSITLPTPKELLAKSDLKSQKVYEEAKSEIKALKEKWQKIQKEQLSQDVLERYKQEYKQMKADAKSKDAKKLLALAKKITNYKKRLKAEKDAFIALKDEYLADQKKIQQLLKEIQKAPQDDFKKLKSTYTLDGSGGINLFGLLFSEKVAHYLREGRKYYAMVAPYLESGDEDKAEEVAPPRGKGRWIKFREYTPSPDLWIAKTELSGSRNGHHFEGQINNIADSQKALGKPLTFRLKGNSEKVQGLVLDGEDNRLGEEVIDTLDFSAERVAMKRLSLKKIEIENTHLAVSGSMKLIDTKKLDSKALLHFKDADISLEDLNGKGAAMMRDMLQQIHTFEVDVSAEGNWVAPAIAVSSDIDTKLSRAFKKVMAKEIVKYRKELKVLLNKEWKKQSEKLKEMTHGMVDVGESLDEDILSVEGLQKKAKELLDANNAEQLAKQKAKEEARKYLHDKEAREKAKNKLKKLFHR